MYPKHSYLTHILLYNFGMNEDYINQNNTKPTLVSVPPELAAILVARGIDTDEKAQKFLFPKVSDLASPYILEGMAEAVAIIGKHIVSKSTITVFGDYDCDGIGASAILYLALKALGANVNVFIPTRQEDGYGLSLNALKRVIHNYHPHLMISVDCGISSAEEVKYAQEAGIEFIVTDHHEPQSVLPDCTIVNPKIQKNACEYCGAGVVFKLVEALKDRDFALQFVDICAISTIADLVPLKGENRVIARLGLSMLSSKNIRAGIKALLRAAGVHTFGKKINSYDVAYKIAPRLNASGRLSNAEKSFRLLVEDDATMLSLLAAELEAENKQRQELCQTTIDEANAMLKDYDLINNKVIVLAKDDWEGGVIGIAAAKLAQDYYRPAILFSKRDNLLKGSCRSIVGISIHDVLNGCSDKIEQFGGHSMAAGLSILPQNLEAFTRAVNAYVAKNYEDALFLDKIRYDAEIDIKKINIEFARSLECFEPYGNENPIPTFLFKAKAVPFKRIGNYNHIKYSANKECELIAFHAYNQLDVLTSKMDKELYLTVEHEIFRNTEKAKCFLKKIVIDNITPTEENILIDYLAALLPENKNDGCIQAKCRPSSLYGHLIITYCKKTFDKLCARFPNYKKAYHCLDTPNPYNTVLLSPQNGIITDKFCLIEVYDTFYDEVAAASDQTTTVKDCPMGFHLNIGGFDIVCIREIYIYLLTTQNGCRYWGQDDLYERFMKKEYTRSRLQFDISCLILREMGLLSFQNNSIIVKNHKVDINQSRILNMVRAICNLS